MFACLGFPLRRRAACFLLRPAGFVRVLPRPAAETVVCDMQTVAKIAIVCGITKKIPLIVFAIQDPRSEKRKNILRIDLY